MTGGSSNLTSLGQAIQRRSRVPVEVWAPMERILVEAKEVDRVLLQTRAAAARGRTRPRAPQG